MPSLLRTIMVCVVGLLTPHVAPPGHGFAPAITSAAQAFRPASQTLEYDVKAAYIFNLLPFTTWPSSAFAAATAPLTVCIAPPNPFADSLKRAFQNEHVGSHPVVVTRVTTPDAVRVCHVLFIASGADPGGLLEQAAEIAPVLTIGESPQFERRGGMITFVVEQGRVRFDVNQTAASRAGIQFSSKILQVARKIS